jgi:hypothetical protein
MLNYSDHEFYGVYLKTRDMLINMGWKEEKPTRTKDKISGIFTNAGLAIYVLYGCEETIRNEVL